MNILSTCNTNIEKNGVKLEVWWMYFVCVCGVWIWYIWKIDLRFRSSHPYINGAYECIIADEIMFDILHWKSNQIHIKLNGFSPPYRTCIHKSSVCVLSFQTVPNVIVTDVSSQSVVKFINANPLHSNCIHEELLRSVNRAKRSEKVQNEKHISL